jgi:uncharacterized protein
VTETLWWILSGALIVGGLVGTVLPALPGTALVLAGIVLGAWIDDFTRVSGTTVGIIAVLAVLAWVLDYAAGLLGARRAGASRQAWSACCSCPWSARPSASTSRRRTSGAQ